MLSDNDAKIKRNRAVDDARQWAKRGEYRTAMEMLAYADHFYPVTESQYHSVTKHIDDAPGYKSWLQHIWLQNEGVGGSLDEWIKSLPTGEPIATN